MKWHDDFYSEMERSFRALGKEYKRPDDWQERMKRIESERRKPFKLHERGVNHDD